MELQGITDYFLGCYNGLRNPVRRGASVQLRRLHSAPGLGRVGGPKVPCYIGVWLPAGCLGDTVRQCVF